MAFHLFGPHLVLQNQIHFIGSLGANVIFQTIPVSKHDGIFTRGKETYCAIFMEIVNWIIKKEPAIGGLTDVDNLIKVYFNLFRCPQTIYQYLFIFNNRFILYHEQQNDRHANNAETYHQEQVNGVIPISFINIHRKAERSHD